MSTPNRGKKRGFPDEPPRRSIIFEYQGRQLVIEYGRLHKKLCTKRECGGCSDCVWTSKQVVDAPWGSPWGTYTPLVHACATITDDERANSLPTGSWSYLATISRLDGPPDSRDIEIVVTSDSTMATLYADKALAVENRALVEHPYIQDGGGAKIAINDDLVISIFNIAPIDVVRSRSEGVVRSLSS